MSRSITMLAVALLAAAALAGCANNDAPAPTTPTGTTPAATSPTPASTTPATATTPAVPTTPTTPTVPTTPGLAATITDVIVVAAPDRVDENGAAEVCFRVLGTGTIPHVAVHFDFEAHPNATAFAEYKGGAVYPGNATAASPVNLPGTFCAWLKPTNQTLYYRAHALAAPTSQKLSEEKVLEVGVADITFSGDTPEVASAGTNVTACWTTPARTSTVAHTAIHHDTASHRINVSFSDYKGGAVYPDNGPASGVNHTLPGPFCANLTMPESGTLYFRAHAIDNGTHLLSKERSIVVAPAIGIASAPTRGAHESKATVCWRVEGTGSVPHTAIHFDTASHPDSTSFSDYKGGALYPGNATAAAPVTLPGTFCTALELAEHETYYYRAHVLKPGERNEVSAEHSIEVYEG